MRAMRIVAVVALALGLAACGGTRGPDGPIDENAGMMVSNETVMSDALGAPADNAANASAPAE